MCPTRGRSSSAYQRTLLVANGTSYRIVHPYFDHPPLFSVLVGGGAWLLGARDLQDVTAAMIRPVAIALSSFSTCLAYVLGRVLPVARACSAAAILIATAPVAVLFGRAVESENLLAPLLLVSLLLAHRLLTGEGKGLADRGPRGLLRRRLGDQGPRCRRGNDLRDHPRRRRSLAAWADGRRGRRCRARVVRDLRRDPRLAVVPRRHRGAGSPAARGPGRLPVHRRPRRDREHDP